MSNSLNDLRLVRCAQLTSPEQLRSELPIPIQLEHQVLEARATIRDILHGRESDRLVVIVGPCSLHDRESSLAYARALAALAPELPELMIVMRTYFEKPRTTVGWKGLINDPHLDGSGDVEAGLREARRLLLEIGALGLPCASELLDPVIPQYLADLLSWVAIGARTTESQTHREMTSGLSMPVGFKNGTEGGLQVALDAMVSAAAPHHFLGVDPAGRVALVTTTGNPDRHIVLRGGRNGSNYGPEHTSAAARELQTRGIHRGVMVDCSHDNSAKDPSQQAGVFRAVLDQVRRRQPGLMGVMLESHLREGRQDWQADPRVPGLSITDGCIGWSETEALLREAAAAVRDLGGVELENRPRHVEPGPRAA